MCMCCAPVDLHLLVEVETVSVCVERQLHKLCGCVENPCIHSILTIQHCTDSCIRDKRACNRSSLSDGSYHVWADKLTSAHGTTWVLGSNLYGAMQ
jgi:hypothetical protein